MKVKTLQIVWHAVDGKRNDPIMAVDIDRSGVLATAGADGSINLWRFKREEPAAAAGRSAGEKTDGSTASVDAIEFVVSLQLHDKTVNCVRFAPDGRTLASASDDQRVVLWRLKPGQTWSTLDDQRQLSRTVCSGHDGDVMDVAWSPDSSRLVSGGVDRIAIVWQAATGKEIDRLPEHLHFVQGVAWDPADQLLATQAADRTMQVFAVPQKASHRGRQQRYKRLFTAKFAPEEELDQAGAAAGASGEEKGADGRGTWRKKRHLFESEAKLPSFVRRLNFTTDGNLLLAPGGRWRVEGKPAAAAGSAGPEATTSVPATLGFVRGQYAVGPGVVLPCEGVDPSVGVRACPAVFTAAPVDWSAVPCDAKPAELPAYSCVWAVAHLQQVSIYSSCAGHAVACMGHHHLDKLTDVCWSHDGSMLVMSSVDGYCSVVLFDPNELGHPVPANRRMQLLPGLAKAQSIRAAIAATAAAKKAAKASSTPAVAATAAAAPPPAASAAVATPAAAAAPAAASKAAAMPPKAAEAAAGKKRRRLAPALVSVSEPAEAAAAETTPAAAPAPPAAAETTPAAAPESASDPPPAGSVAAAEAGKKKKKRRRVAPMLVATPAADSPPSPSDVAPKPGSFGSAEAALRPVTVAEPAQDDDGESIGSKDDEDVEEEEEKEQEEEEAGAWLAPEGSAE